MKIQLTLKDPEMLHNLPLEDFAGVVADPTDEKQLRDAREEFIDEFLSKLYVTHGEYITIEFDTIDRTAVVLKRP